MKKMILLSAMALVAAGASAQYSCDPTTETLLENGTPAKLWYIQLSETSINTLESKGTQLQNIAPDDVTRFLYIWEGTFVGGPSTNPAVGFEDGGYVSLEVTNVGWSGAGYCATGAGENLEGMSMENTRFHFAYCTNSTAPESVALLVLPGDGCEPAKVSVGKSAFNDNGVIMPLIAGEITDEWQGVDISFADLKKIWPGFAPANLNAYTGNYLSILAGGVPGTNICLDAIYFYNMTDTGVEGVAEDAALIITDKTINANGVNGIEVYDLAGRKVAATEGCVLGLNNLTNGIYVAKAGNAVQKFVVK